MVKHRAREPAIAARLCADAEGGARVIFDAPESGVAPGQGCVAYQGSRVLGGGWIKKAPIAAETMAGSPRASIAGAPGGNAPVTAALITRTMPDPTP
jgi:tRNA-specific 2-thiouridylase